MYLWFYIIIANEYASAQLIALQAEFLQWSAIMWTSL